MPENQNAQMDAANFSALAPELKKMEAKQAFEQMRSYESGGQASTPMPEYVSHKKVWALKIKAIHLDSDARPRDEETDGSAIIVPEDRGFGPFRVPHAYVAKHQPKAGGYYVQYQDGYASWSPAEAFEEGYTKV